MTIFKTTIVVEFVVVPPRLPLEGLVVVGDSIINYTRPICACISIMVPNAYELLLWLIETDRHGLFRATGH